MKITKEQLNKMLEKDYAKYEVLVNSESVQEIIKLGEYLKQNPILDLGVYTASLRTKIDLINNAKEQLAMLKQLNTKDLYIIEFLCNECTSIFSFLEGVPVQVVPKYLKVIERFIVNLKNINTDTLSAGDIMLILQEHLINGEKDNK